MKNYRLNHRRIPNTDSGLKCSWNYKTGGYGEVIPITAHEIIDREGVVVAVFWNNESSDLDLSENFDGAAKRAKRKLEQLNKTRWKDGVWG